MSEMTREEILERCHAERRHVTRETALAVIRLFAQPGNASARAYLDHGELPPDSEPGLTGEQKLYRELFPGFSSLSADDQFMARYVATYLISVQASEPQPEPSR